jgi:hypothetical protein
MFNKAHNPKKHATSPLYQTMRAKKDIYSLGLNPILLLRKGSCVNDTFIYKLIAYGIIPDTLLFEKSP